MQEHGEGRSKDGKVLQCARNGNCGLYMKRDQLVSTTSIISWPTEHSVRAIFGPTKNSSWFDGSPVQSSVSKSLHQFFFFWMSFFSYMDQTNHQLTWSNQMVRTSSVKLVLICKPYITIMHAHDIIKIEKMA